MLCQKCNKKIASVFISSIINGKEIRIYLCDDCIKDYQLVNFNYQSPFSIKDIMDKFKLNEGNYTCQEKENSVSIDNNYEENDITCPNCCSTYNEYRKTGKLGCSRCYEVFEDKLKNTYDYEEYIGKIPKKDNNYVNISKEIKILKEDLNMAVQKEEYEKAAEIRDKIKDLAKCNE